MDPWVLALVGVVDRLALGETLRMLCATRSVDQLTCLIVCTNANI